MKNLLLATCLIAGIGIALAAAPGPGPEASATTTTRAITLTKALAHRIHLNEGQYIAVKKLHLDMLTERRALEIQLSGASPEQRDTRLAAAQQHYETALAELLDPQQLLAYQNLRTNLTAHRLR